MVVTASVVEVAGKMVRRLLRQNSAVMWWQVGKGGGSRGGVDMEMEAGVESQVALVMVMPVHCPMAGRCPLNLQCSAQRLRAS